MRNRIFKTILSIALCSSAILAYAQDNTPRTEKFSRLAAGAAITVKDADHGIWSVTGTSSNPPVCQVGTDYYRIYTIYDRVFIEVDKSYKFNTDFDFSIFFNIRVYDQSNVLIQQNLNKELKLNYRVNDPYTHKVQVQYENTKCNNRVEVSIVSVSNPANIPLSHIIAGASVHKQSQQYMPADPEETILAGVTKTYNASTNSLDISWTTATWATSYDIQWYYTDNYDPFKSSTLPKLNDELMSSGTKLNINKCHYSIPLMYDRGHLAFRVRANGKLRGATVNPESEIPGKWQHDFTDADLATLSPYVYPIETGHSPELNWQSSITFAEQGKKMLQAAYYDGVSRERQKISLLSQGGRHDLETGMLEETVYDEEGRAAARILPAPTLVPHVQFFAGFNRSDVNGTKNFSSLDFDFMDETHICNNLTNGLKTSSGASAYYSSSNPLLADPLISPSLKRMYALLPDAGKYPYALTIYTNDNTGRIREQTGVGTSFKLGSNHTTKYYYGKPLQEELDRLFGSDVGYATNYQKTMVKDANGQFSISYKDLSGRVVATSLAGKAPSNLGLLNSSPEALDENEDEKEPIIIEADLLNKTASTEHGTDDLLYLAEGKRVLSSNLVVSSEAKRNFYYRLQHPVYEPGCINGNETPPSTTSAVTPANFPASSSFHTTPAAAIVDFKVADIDQDGDQDILYTVSEKLIIVQNRMSGNTVNAASFYTVIIPLPSNTSPLIEVRDLDRDQHPELIVYRSGGTGFTIYKNNSDQIEPEFTLVKTFTMPASVTIRAIVARDYDQGTDLPLIRVAADVSGTNMLYTYNIIPSLTVAAGLFNFVSSTPTPLAISPASGALNMYQADISTTHPGKELIISAANGQIYIYSGTLTLTTTVSAPFAFLPRLAFADLGNDDITDMVAYSTSATAVYYLNGSASLATSMSSAFSATGVVSLFTADLNGNQRADIVYTTATHLVFVQNNSSGFVSATPVAITGVAYGCDLNTDGKPDFIFTGTGSSEKDFTCYLNATNNTTGCYECVLDLSISLQSKECGEEQLPDLVKKTDPLTDEVTEYNYTSVGPDIESIRYGVERALLPATCPAPTVFTRGGEGDAAWIGNKDNEIKAGEYLLYRTLTVNQHALDVYANNYVKYNICLKTYKEFEEDEMGKMDFEECDKSCADRRKSLGSSWETSDYSELTEPEYEAIKAIVEKECGKDYTGCESYRETMLIDMSPEGQYGKVREDHKNANANKALPEPGAVINPAVYPLSVFNEENLLPQKISRPAPNWRNPFNPDLSLEAERSYLDENGAIDYITVVKNPDGSFTPAVHPAFGTSIIYDKAKDIYKIKPDQLNDVKDFLVRWKPEWAASLLIYHPEYGYYLECMNRVESNKRDAKMIQTQTASAADNLFPGWKNKLTSTGSIAAAQFVAEDPYFQGTEKAAEKAAFVARLLEYSESGSNRTIWDVTSLIRNYGAACASLYAYTALASSGNVQVRDEDWQMFRSLYISLKQQILQRHDVRAAIRDGFYNGCISKDPFNTNKDLFDQTFYDNPLTANLGSNNTLGRYYTGFNNNYWSFFMFNFKDSYLAPFANTQIYNPEQPCVASRYKLYHGKQARFYPDVQMDILSEADVCNDMTSTYPDFAVPFCQDKVNALLNKGEEMANARAADNCRQCPDAAFMTALLNQLLKTGSSNIQSCQIGPLDPFRDGIVRYLNTNHPYLTYTPNDLFHVASSFSSGTWRVDIYAASAGMMLTIGGPSTIYLSVNLPGVNSLSEIASVCCLRAKGSVDEDLATSFNFELTIQKHLKEGDAGYNGLFSHVPLAGGMPNIAKLNVTGTAGLSKSLVSCDKAVFFRPMPVTTTIQSFLNALTYKKPLVNLYASGSSSTTQFGVVTSTPYNMPWTSVTYSRNSAPNPGPEMHHLLMSSCIHENYMPNFMAAFYTSELAAYPIMNCEENSDKVDHVYLTRREVTGLNPGIAFIFHDMDVKAPSGFTLTQDETTFFNNLESSRSFTLHTTIPFDDFRRFDNIRVENGVVKIDGYYVVSSTPTKGTFTLSSSSITLYETATDLMSDVAYGENRVVIDKQYEGVPYSKCDRVPVPDEFIETNLSVKCSGDAMEEALYRLHELLADDGLTEGRLEYTVPRSCGLSEGCNQSYRFVSRVPFSSIHPDSVQGIGRVYGSEYLMKIHIGADEEHSKPLIDVIVTCTIPKRPCMRVDPNPDLPFRCYDLLCGEIPLEGTDFGLHYNNITPDPECSQISYPSPLCRWDHTPMLSPEFLQLYTPVSRNFTSGLTPDYTPRFYSYMYGMGGAIAVLEHAWADNNTQNVYCFLEGAPGNSDCHAKPHTMFMKLPAQNTSTLSDYKMVWGKNDISVKPNTEYVFRFELYSVTPNALYTVKVMINGATVTAFRYKDLYEFPWNSMMNETLDVEIYVLNSTNGGEPGRFFGLNNIRLTQECRPTICCPVEFPKVMVQSNCREMLENIARDNAHKAYETYISDIRSLFKKKYMEKCLNGVDETFTMKYTDDEHHFTLYYYDQAGNLVRTIPPAGVKPIYEQVKLNAIKAERASGKRTKFTEHTMATTYRYNSLNQLVYQAMPDHDEIDDFRSTEQTGAFDTDAKINDFVFPGNGNTGFAVGEDRSGTINGHIFKTPDKGAKWSELSTFTLNDLNDLYTGTYSYSEPDADLFFGVGNNAMLVTKEGSEYNLSSLPLNGVNLVKITSYLDTDKETLTIYVVADDGSLFTKTYSHNTEDELIEGSWQGPGNSLRVKLAGKLKDIKHYGALGMYATCDKGYIYFSDNHGTAWTIINRKNTSIGSELKKSVVSGNGALMVYGEKGMLIKAATDPTNPEASWKKLNTGFTGDIKDAAFATAQKAVLLIANRLYATSDGGSTITAATLPSTPLTYNTMNIVAVRYMINKYYCITEGGHILESENGSTWTAITADALTINGTTGNVSSFYVTQAVIGTNRICYVAGTVNGYCVYKGAGITGGSFAPYSSSSILKVYVTYKSSQYHVIAQNADMKVVRANSGSPTLAWISGSYSGALFVRPDYTTYIASGTLFKTTTDYTASSLTWTDVPAPSVALPASLNSLDVYQGNKLLATGTGGSMIVVNPSDGAATNYSANITFDASLNGIVLFDLYNTLTQSIGIVGQSGLYIVSDYVIGETPKWVIRPSGTHQDLNDAVPYSNQIKAVGNKGLLCTLNSAGGTVITSGLSTYATYDFTRLIDRPEGYFGPGGSYIGAETYIATNTRKVLGIAGTVTDYDLSPFASKAGALAFGTDNSPLAAGSGGLVWKLQSSSFVKQNSALPPAFKTIAMSNNSNGIAAGVSGNAWRTTNGGSSWKQVTTLGSYTTTDFVKVAFHNPTTGIMIGKISGGNTVALRTTDGGATWTSVLSAAHPARYNNISVYGNTYVIVGDNNLVRISKNGGLTWDSPLTLSGTAQNITAVHMSTEASIFVAGGAGYLYHIDISGSGTTVLKKQPDAGSDPGFWDETINAVYFTDDLTGYLVTDNNNVFKTVNAGTAWTRLPVNGIVATAPNFKGIAAANREDILVMGDNGTTTKEFRLYDMTKELSTRFYYDRLGRMVLSQNSKQYGLSGDNLRRYSYTLYDFKGRITEVGETQVNATNPAENLYTSGKLNDALFTSWLTGSTRKQVTKTYYDVFTLLGNLPLSFTQKNLRNRVAASTYQETYNASANIYDYGVHYNYDIHGNVNEMLTENRAISIKPGTNVNYDGLIFKHTSYTYDLLSGKVDRVNYQEGKPDQFFHRYQYDQQNKLTDVYTSADGFNWDQDASYEYYLHGPLARTELGEEHVQGIDYSYTLQGWLKAVNGPRLGDAAYDLGQDSRTGSDNISFARDEMGFSLGYYTNDFAAIDVTAANSPVITTSSSLIQPANLSSDLYNGNIGHMVTAIRKLDPSGPLASAYKYDQLNRLSSATYYNNFNAGTNAWGNSGSALPDHMNTFTYDANGNIKKQVRKGSSAINIDMDDLEYIYDPGRNRLKGVNDAASALLYTDDIDNQGVTSAPNTYRNYEYDAIGNLVKDKAEEIDQIEWNTYGKIKRITRTSGSIKPDLEFTYGSDGNRVSKKVIPKSGFPELTFYSRDAQGNVMGTYTKTYLSDIYIGGLEFREVNDELLALAGQSSFEAFINYAYSSGYFTSLPSALTSWNANNPEAFDISGMSPVNSLRTPGQPMRLAGIPVFDISGAFTANSANTELFFNQLCMCMPVSQLAELFLYNNTGYNSFMNQVQMINPGLYFGTLAPITWTDYMGPDHMTVLNALQNNLSCMDMSAIIAQYTSDPVQYDDFWQNQFLMILTKLHPGCQLATDMFLNAIYDYNPTAVYDHLVATSGGVSGYFNYLVLGDPKMMLDAIFAYDMSLDPDATEHYSWVVNESGNTITNYMALVQSFLSGPQYEQLLKNLQPNSPAVVEQTHVKERYLYGSGRLGSFTQPQLLGSVKFTATYANGSFGSVNFIETPVVNTLPAPVSGLATQTVNRGYKGFELANHLGNVLAVVSDRKTQTETTEYTDIYEYSPYIEPLWQNYNSGTVEGYSDSYSEGVYIDGDDENGGVLEVDGLQAGKLYVITFDIASASISSGNIIAHVEEGPSVNLYTGKHHLLFRATAPQTILYIVSDGANFEIQLDELSLKRIDHYDAEVLQASDYSPFGAPMQGRSYNSHKQVMQAPALSNTFASDVEGWTDYTPAAVLTQNAGRLKVQCIAVWAIAKKEVRVVKGKAYVLKYTIDMGTATSITVPVYDHTVTALLPNTQTITASGTYEYRFVANDDVINILYEYKPGNPSSGVFYLDDVSLREDQLPYRFGFNGKENDGETYGEGNAYDFGERIYNSRLGRWLAVDLAKKEATSWTPYRFGFNNPLRYTDPNGAFEIDETTAKKYPALNAMLKNISEIYRNKPAEFKEAFREYSQLSDEQVYKMLEYKLVKDGTPVEANQDIPRIQVGNLDKSTVGSTDGTMGKEDKKTVSLRGTIILNKRYIKKVEKANRKKDQLDKRTYNEFMQRTIFHETTHYGDFCDGVMDKTDMDLFINPNTGKPEWMPQSKESGDQFEEKAYGYSSTELTFDEFIGKLRKEERKKMKKESADQDAPSKKTK